MFVPVDLLRPILAELQQDGRSAASRRAWIGVNAVEHDGRLHVLRVTPDSPADAAGLRPGDRIVAIDGTTVDALAPLWAALWRGAAEREVRLDIERAGAPRTVRVFSVDRSQSLRRPKGI
jgi:C-terminal processing protease CtpA/Prc